MGMTLRDYNNYKKIVRLGIVIMCLLILTTIDLFAYETKTQLDINQSIFAQKSGTVVKEMRKIDYIGHVLLIKPMEAIKDNTESLLLNNKASVTHDEVEMHTTSQHIRDTKHGGPKISLTF
ncbi:MAG: hypothetical protein KKH94_12845 [Candidatus Omnitrophica bacterium]|nr:hypothetical protein [Candidatus Omnitrophota bacterium]